MEFKGTKGKWEIVDHNWSNTSIYSNNKTVCKFELDDIDDEDLTENYLSEEENKYNILLISKTLEILNMLARCNEVIELLDCSNSDLINEINKSTQCPDNRKYKALSLEIKQLIKEATEL